MELPPGNKSVILPASNFRSLINPDAEKVTERGQTEAQQLRSSSDITSKESSGHIHFRRPTSDLRRKIR